MIQIPISLGFRAPVAALVFMAGAMYAQLSQAYDFALQSQTVRYAVDVAGHDAGELEVVIERDGNSIKTTSISHLSTIAKMFVSGQTVETWFTINGETVQVEKGQIVSHRNNEVTHAFVIDRQAGEIQFAPGGPQPASDTELFESTSFPIVLMSTPKMKYVHRVPIREINPKKVRWYEYHRVESEMLKLNGKTYKTWKITRNKRGEADRTQTFWLDRNNYRVPVKIVSVKNKKKTVMTLVSN